MLNIEDTVPASKPENKDTLSIINIHPEDIDTLKFLPKIMPAFIVLAKKGKKMRMDLSLMKEEKP